MVLVKSARVGAPINTQPTYLIPIRSPFPNSDTIQGPVSNLKSIPRARYPNHTDNDANQVECSAPQPCTMCVYLSHFPCLTSESSILMAGAAKRRGACPTLKPSLAI